MIDLTTLETYKVEAETGMPLDLIIWQRYRRETPGLVEATLDINPGLAAHGPMIPHGTVIQIPLDRPDSFTRLPVVRLW